MNDTDDGALHQSGPLAPHLGRPWPPAGRPRPPQPVDPDELHEVRRVLRLLLRRKWQILLVAALVVVPVAVGTYLAEPLYRSSALVEIDPEPVQVLPYREVDVPNIGPNYEMFMKSQEQVLRGTTLISKIGQRLSAEKDEALRDEVPNLGRRLGIQRLENTQLFRLSYAASSPEVAAKVADIFAKEYIGLHFESKQKIRIEAREMLQRELETLEQRVQLSEKELVDFAHQNQIQPPGAGENLVQQRLAQLSRQVADAEAEAFVAQARMDTLQQASVTQFPERLVTPVMSGLVARQAQLEHDLIGLQSTFGPNWPAVVQKRREMELVGEQLTREKTSALAQAREQASFDLAAATSRRRMLAETTAEQKALANRLESASIQYNNIRREVETNQKMYEALLERLKQTSVTSGMEFAGFHVIDPPVPSRQVDSPRPLWNLSLASIFGLVLGVSLVLARHYWDTSIATVEEVEQIAVLPVLGTVPLVAMPTSRRFLGRGRPALPGANESKHVVESKRVLESKHALETKSVLGLAVEDPAANSAGGKVEGRIGEKTDGEASVPAPAAATPFWSSQLAGEAVRNVCASILLSRSGRPPRVVMVTSAVPGEGKTTLVHELGRAFAERGASTVLVECDLRRPTFHDRFGVAEDGGLSLFLAGHISPIPHIHASGTPNLFVVTAGPPVPNPPALLGSTRMQGFLRELLSSFRFVLLDTPPVLPMADARVLAPMVEGVVLTVRAGHVAKPLVRRATTLLEASGANLLGAVLNGADEHGPDSPYYHYYRRYYAS